MGTPRLRAADRPLTGSTIRLEPLSRAHLDGLVAAALEDRSTFGLTVVPSNEAAMLRYVDRAIADREAGLAVPYATLRRDDGRVLGATRFANVERWEWPEDHPLARPAEVPDAIEIGWTWLAASAQRTAANTEAKRLMLGLAFEEWKVHRVTLKTDARNERSRANIERVGGKLDGIVRAHMPASDGGIRDTALYSILIAEWPAIRKRLDERLGRG